ncbi:M16 family metallopeptidase [sulfur-oxidizing endosymbiont of Gigantopelta aegis]|uniref:M16 family metallopeptidase n=1 Tax=sulfur-oxidizing endosymbiont of Gigantopelta aegis TaxID=2794934 RepID=UPI0018DC03BA|nr:pitrilysin family protein [sulfur-oxidizing endosymbiont of Gigantopelta aegis]
MSLWQYIGCAVLLVFPLLVGNAHANSGAFSESVKPFVCQLLTPAQKSTFQQLEVYHRQLNNGLQVYLLENHQLPVFSLRMIVDVGAADEQINEAGYAHLFEHMMFKGSKNVPDGGHFDAIRQIGGRINASTDYDKTVYWTEAPAMYLERVLWLEAERLANLTINEATLANQRAAVLEEKLLRIDNVPYFKIASEFMVSAWQGTDYDHLIIGSEEDISTARVPEVTAFFKQYYQPDNIILVLVGDFDTDEVMGQIRQYFSVLENDVLENDVLKNGSLENDRIKNNPVFVTKKKGKSERHYDPLAPFPLYALGWHTPGKHNSDFYAVELLADILLNHDAARLKRLLKDDRALVFETIGMPLTFEQAGITAMGMVPHSYADFSQIQMIVKTELEKIQLNGVSDAELCSAKKHRQLMILEKTADNRQIAALIGDGVLFFNDPLQFISALDAYQGVEHAQIKQVAKQYFTDDWLALEIEPGVGMRLVKWLMEVLPQGWSESLEQQFL